MPEYVNPPQAVNMVVDGAKSELNHGFQPNEVVGSLIEVGLDPSVSILVIDTLLSLASLPETLVSESLIEGVYAPGISEA